MGPFSSLVAFRTMVTSFTPHCSSSLEYMAVYSGGHMCMYRLRIIIVTRLNTSRISRVVGGINWSTIG